MVQTTFIVPHWNNYPLLARCLASIFAQTEKDFAVLVVDNGSADGSPLLAARDFPAARVIRLEKNLGFSAALNRGIAASRSEYLAFVNNDVRLAPDWLEKMLDGLKGDPSLGAVAGKLLMDVGPVSAFALDASTDRCDRADRPPVHRTGLPSPLASLLDVGPVGDRAAGPTPPHRGGLQAPRIAAAGPPPPRIASAGNIILRSGFGRDRGYGEADRGQFERREEVFWASGGACLIPRRLFADIGPWDESFFAYFEDIDLGLRARLQGYRCLYLPEAVGWHVGGATGAGFPGRRAALCFRNAVMVALKNFPGPLLRRHLGAVLFAHLRALVYLGLQGYAGEAFRSELSLARHLRRLLAERGRIQRARTVPVSEIAACLGPEDFSLSALRGWFSGLAGRPFNRE